jgi:hypothetical protein
MYFCVKGNLKTYRHGHVECMMQGSAVSECTRYFLSLHASVVVLVRFFATVFSLWDRSEGKKENQHEVS